SVRNWVPTWLLVAPRARRGPISPRRSSTEMTMTLATPTPPISSATAPRPSTRLPRALVAAARAMSTSEGRLTWTAFGSAGVGGRGQHPLHRGRLARVRAQVNPGVAAGAAEHRGGGREAHEHRVVDFRCEGYRPEDPDDGEVAAGNVDLHGEAQVRNAELLGCRPAPRR